MRYRVLVNNFKTISCFSKAISDSLSREIVEQIQLRVMDIYAVDDKFKASTLNRFTDEF